MTIPTSNLGNSAVDRMSIMTTDTAMSARSMRESIMSLYGHRSYYQIIMDPREGGFDIAPEMPVDQSRISMIIEDQLQPKDTTRSSADLLRLVERDTNVRELTEGQLSILKFVKEVEADVATGSLLDRVSVHKNDRRSIKSEETDASTYLKRVYAYYRIPGNTKLVESTPDTQASVMDKPLPSLPSEWSNGQTPDIDYPYRAKAIWEYVANSDEVYDISFAKHEILEVSDVSGDWWAARNDAGDTGTVPSNYLNLL